jgi:hypothetical protein
MDTANAVPANFPNPPYDRLDESRNPQAGAPTATAPPQASPDGLSAGLVALIIVVALVAFVLAVFIVGRLARRNAQPRSPAGDGPTSAAGPPRRPEASHLPGTAGPSSPGDPVAPAGFGKGARPTFEPPREDHPSDE